MFELDDKDLVAIAGSRAFRAKRWYITCGVGIVLFMVVCGFYVVFSHLFTVSVLLVLLSLWAIWVIVILTMVWMHKRQIFKKLREEYSEIIKG